MDRHSGIAEQPSQTYQLTDETKVLKKKDNEPIEAWENEGGLINERFEGEKVKKRFFQHIQSDDFDIAHGMEILKELPRIEDNIVIPAQSLRRGMLTQDVEAHTKDVIKNAQQLYPEQGFGVFDVDKNDERKLVYLGLYLHDIGKNNATFAKSGDQHKFTSAIMIDVFGEMGLALHDSEKLEAIFSNDIIGELMQGKISEIDAYKKITALATQIAVEPSKVHELLNFYYQSDVGAYADLKGSVLSFNHITQEIEGFRDMALEKNTALQLLLKSEADNNFSLEEKAVLQKYASKYFPVETKLFTDMGDPERLNALNERLNNRKSTILSKLARSTDILGSHMKTLESEKEYSEKLARSQKVFDASFNAQIDINVQIDQNIIDRLLNDIPEVNLEKLGILFQEIWDENAILLDENSQLAINNILNKYNEFQALGLTANESDFKQLVLKYFVNRFTSEQSTSDLNIAEKENEIFVLKDEKQVKDQELRTELESIQAELDKIKSLDTIYQRLLNEFKIDQIYSSVDEVIKREEVLITHGTTVGADILMNKIIPKVAWRVDVKYSAATIVEGDSSERLFASIGILITDGHIRESYNQNIGSNPGGVAGISALGRLPESLDPLGLQDKRRTDQVKLAISERAPLKEGTPNWNEFILDRVDAIGGIFVNLNHPPERLATEGMTEDSYEIIFNRAKELSLPVYVLDHGVPYLSVYNPRTRSFEKGQRVELSQITQNQVRIKDLVKNKSL